MADEQRSAWQDALAKFEEIVDDLGLEDDERESFITSAMTRKGFKPVTTWSDPEPDNSSGKTGDFFSAKKQQREQREVGNKRAGGQY